MYNLSVLSIFKNEANLIKEWIEHYILEGVEHFYLIDNGSTDNYENEIKKYEDKITLIKDNSDTPGNDGFNAGYYWNKHMIPLLSETKWILIPDFDEYIWATNENETLKDILNNVSDDIGLILVPWILFGSSGNIKQPSSIIPYFNRRINYDIQRSDINFRNENGKNYSQIKSIVRANAVSSFDLHNTYIKPGFKIVDSHLKESISINRYLGYISEDHIKNSKIRLNHYIIQSKEYFFKPRKILNADFIFFWWS